jgi:hypothetical protein
MNQASIHNGNLSQLMLRLRPRRGQAFGLIIVAALLAFEIFNYSTTDFALADLLGGLSFLGLSWSTILAIAFCGIDFAGIARLFTPEEGTNEPNEVWYLFGAWLLAAAMNAALTWWGVAVAVHTHPILSNTVVNQKTLLNVVPVFVAVMVWLIRVLIIGTFSMAGDRLFSMAQDRRGTMLGSALRTRLASAPATERSIATRSLPRPGRPSPSIPFHPAPKPEPSYHPVGMAARPQEKDLSVRR